MHSFVRKPKIDQCFAIWFLKIKNFNHLLLCMIKIYGWANEKTICKLNLNYEDSAFELVQMESVYPCISWNPIRGFPLYRSRNSYTGCHATSVTATPHVCQGSNKYWIPGQISIPGSKPHPALTKHPGNPPHPFNRWSAIFLPGEWLHDERNLFRNIDWLKISWHDSICLS